MEKINGNNKINSFKLMATDMDGTLIGSNGKIPESTILSIKKAVALGKYFILSSGRPQQAVTKYIENLGLQKMPFIIYNGAKVIFNNQVVFDAKLSEADVKFIADEGKKRAMTMICWAEDKLFANVNNERVAKYKTIGGLEPIIVDDFSKLKNATKFVWYGTVEETKRFHNEMGELLSGRVNVHPTRIDFLEFVNKDCSKGVALKLICDFLNVPIENTIAIGDGFNDVSMLELAGLGVAVGNADEKVKSIADLVVEGCDDLGVEKVINKYLLNDNLSF